MLVGVDVQPLAMMSLDSSFEILAHQQVVLMHNAMMVRGGDGCEDNC